jgi:hypothetical protein
MGKNWATPAERLDNGIDIHRTDRQVPYRHHFAAIAGGSRHPAGLSPTAEEKEEMTLSRSKDG